MPHRASGLGVTNSSLRSFISSMHTGDATPANAKQNTEDKTGHSSLSMLATVAPAPPKCACGRGEGRNGAVPTVRCTQSERNGREGTRLVRTPLLCIRSGISRAIHDLGPRAAECSTYEAPSSYASRVPFFRSSGYCTVQYCIVMYTSLLRHLQSV